MNHDNDDDQAEWANSFKESGVSVEPFRSL